MPGALALMALVLLILTVTQRLPLRVWWGLFKVRRKLGEHLRHSKRLTFGVCRAVDINWKSPPVSHQSVFHLSILLLSRAVSACFASAGTFRAALAVRGFRRAASRVGFAESR